MTCVVSLTRDRSRRAPAPLLAGASTIDCHDTKERPKRQKRQEQTSQSRRDTPPENNTPIRHPPAAERGSVHAQICCMQHLWSHARREFEAIKDGDPVRCTEALELIGGLYANEEMIRRKKLSGAAKLAWRREHSVPIVEAFWRWCRTIVEDLSRPPRDPLLLAVNYARNRRDALEVCLSDPDIPIDTNHLERGHSCHPDGTPELVVLLDRTRRRTCRYHPEPGLDVSHARGGPLHLAGRCVATDRNPSRPRRGVADATTVERALCRQPVDLRHRKRRPGTRAQIRSLNLINQHPYQATSQNARLPLRNDL